MNESNVIIYTELHRNDFSDTLRQQIIEAVAMTNERNLAYLQFMKT